MRFKTVRPAEFFFIINFVWERHLNDSSTLIPRYLCSTVLSIGVLLILTEKLNKPSETMLAESFLFLCNKDIRKHCLEFESMKFCFLAFSLFYQPVLEVSICLRLFQREL